MPRSRSRKKRGGRQARGARVSDSSILIDLLGLLDRAGFDATGADLVLLDAFERAAWSFHAGPGPGYAGPGSLEQNLAGLRAREWFLFEFELPSGLTAAEEWVLEREGEPGSAGDRRAVSRLVNGECGVFDVRDLRRDGSMILAPLPDGDPVTARTIERGFEMLPGSDAALPQFGPGDTIAGRLYWLDDNRAELSAGAGLVSPEARARLLADPSPRKELRSGLALEAILGADASMLLSAAADACYPSVVNNLLLALSDGTFEYRGLWRELEGEPDPVAVTRQLLLELDAWTGVEPELLAWAVAGAWLRRRGAAAGRALTPEALARERRALDSHVRTVLDVPAHAAWPEPAAGTPVEISSDDMASIADLEADEVEWIVDVRPADWRRPDSTAFSPSPFPLACAIVEQAITPFDGLEAGARDENEEADEDEDDEEAGDPWRGDQPRRSGSGRADLGDNPHEEPLEDEEEDPFGDKLDEDEPDDTGLEGADEGGPLLLHAAIVNEGEDEVEVVLDALVETLLAEGRVARPRRIVFRQRALAARLGETLRDAGLDVALRHFTEAVDVATMDVGLEEEEEAKRHAGAANERADAGDVTPASELERRSYERLVDAARRAREGLDILASNGREEEEVAFRLALAQPLSFPFNTLEGVEDQVGSIAIVVDDLSADLSVRIHLAAPGAASRFDCHGPAGDLLIETGDTFVLEICDPADGDDDFPRLLREAGLGPPSDGSWVTPLRFRRDRPSAYLRGRELEVAAGVMEAAAAVAERVPEARREEPITEQTRVEPLGDVTVEWRGWS
ncbi:MAG: hypothetical protein EHM24_15315 [Acidobacteria bacterium]|nr:MAG: hypothetical protein EHM24_15315 [Acidobacteriota bacterium]